MAEKTFITAITGASGMLYAKNLIGHLAGGGNNVLLAVTSNGEKVMEHELGVSAGKFVETFNSGSDATFQNSSPAQRGARITRLDINDLAHPVCSGSFRHSGMIVIPSSVNSLSRIACGLAGNVIERAAQVCLKEKFPLIIVIRETPLSSIIIENMLRLSNAGAVILPASPGFYTKPQTLTDLADFISSKIMNLLLVPHGIKSYEV